MNLHAIPRERIAIEYYRPPTSGKCPVCGDDIMSPFYHTNCWADELKAPHRNVIACDHECPQFIESESWAHFFITVPDGQRDYDNNDHFWCPPCRRGECPER